MHTLLDEFTARLERRGIMQGITRLGKVKGYPIRVDYPAERIAGRNWMLVGESAGLVNPVTGEGIDLALESGVMAACSLDEGIKAGRRSHAAYQIQVWQRFGPLFNGLRTIRQTLLNPFFMDYAIWLISQHPFLRHIILNIAQGTMYPHRILHPLVLAEFFIPVTPRYIYRQLRDGIQKQAD